MGRPKTVNPDLPPNVVARKLKRGGLRYYFNTRGTKIALGENLERAIAMADQLSRSDRVSAKAEKLGLLPLKALLVNSQPAIRSPAVYFLLKDSAVIYVGQSADVFFRLAQHSKTIPFDAFFWIPCQVDQLRELERRYIQLYEPPLNKAERLTLARKQDRKPRNFGTTGSQKDGAEFATI